MTTMRAVIGMTSMSLAALSCAVDPSVGLPAKGAAPAEPRCLLRDLDHNGRSYRVWPNGAVPVH